MRFLVILLFSFCSVLKAQELKLTESKALEADSFVGIDSYGHTYYVKDQVLHKKGTLGDLIFNDFQLGPITRVDIINPLQVIVFYEDSNAVVFLDNRLNETERILFNTLTRPSNIGTVSNAGNNQLWAFNIDSQQLELFNYRTQRRTVVSQPFEGEVRSISSNFNDCYVLTENKLLRFNVYGSFISEFAQVGWDRVILNNKNTFIVDDYRLLSISEEGKTEVIETPLELTIKDLHLTQEFLYIYDGNFLHTFALTRPK